MIDMKVGIVGCGYVGLSTAVKIAENNLVSLFDRDNEKLEMLRNGEVPFEDTCLNDYYRKNRANIKVEDNKQSFILNCNTFFIAISTDFRTDIMQLDTEGIEEWIDNIFSVKKEEALIVIRSTIPISFAERMISKYNNDNILVWPEFLREGNAFSDALNPSRIVIGGKLSCSRKIVAMVYGDKDSEFLIKFVSTKEAETIKLFSNSYLAMRVAFFNELDAYAEKQNINIKEIIEGVCADNRIGQYYNNPSFGYGGYCLPKDTKQLAAELGDDGLLIKSISDSNQKRMNYIADKIESLGYHNVGVYRLQMKKASDNIRESAIISILKDLLARGFNVYIYEPLLSSNKIIPEACICTSLKELNNWSEVIISNRLDEELLPYKNKVYSRDVFMRD